MPFKYIWNTTSILRIGATHLTEHNRSPLDVQHLRIGVDKRTLRGELRRQVVDLKRTFSVSWTDLPSYAAYTVDLKSGARDMRTIFNNNLGEQTLTVVHGNNTSESYNVMVESYSYSIVKRTQYDLWNCSLEMIEV